MNHRQNTLLIGTSIIMAIGCTTETGEGFDSEMSEMEDAQDAWVELGLNHDNQTIVVAFESMMPKDLLVRGEPVLIRELHSGLRMGTISVPANMDTADVVTELRQRADVRFAELDRNHSAIADQDPGYSSQWNMHQIGTETAWDSGYDGSGIVVAVIDTGVATAAPMVCPSPVGNRPAGISSLMTRFPAMPMVTAPMSPVPSHSEPEMASVSPVSPTMLKSWRFASSMQTALDTVRMWRPESLGRGPWRGHHQSFPGFQCWFPSRTEAVSYAAEHGVLVVAASGNEYRQRRKLSRRLPGNIGRRRLQRRR